MYFGNNKTQKHHMMIDTQNDWSFIAGTECTTCYAPHRYNITNNSSVKEDFGVKNVREMKFTGKSAVDETCVLDLRKTEYCVKDFHFGVVTSQDQPTYDTIDGVLGLRPQI
jgi:hypothetical protein